MRMKIMLVLVLLWLGTALHAEEKTMPTENNPWPAEKAREWYDRQPWMVGVNYLPATAINSTEMWQKESFDPKTIDRELALAEECRFNTIRVFVQYIVWEDDPAGMKDRLEQFLAIADKHHIKTIVVLFDICNFSGLPDPVLGKQPDQPSPPKSNGGWTPSPGPKRAKDDKAWPKLEAYVKDLISTHAHDARVLAWETWNEPLDERVPLKLVENSFLWARQATPDQPVMATIYGSKEMEDLVIRLSDVISFHNYDNAQLLEQEINDRLKLGRPILCTEWMFRPYDSTPAACLPIFVKHRVAALNWGFVNGKSRTDIHMRPTGKPAEMWQHDLFHTDHSPYNAKEIEEFRKAIEESKDVKKS